MRRYLRQIPIAWMAAAAIVSPIAGCRDSPTELPTRSLHPSAMVVDGDPGCYNEYTPDGEWIGYYCDAGGGSFSDSFDEDSGDACCSGAHVPDYLGQQDINDAKKDFSSDPSCAYIGTFVNRLQVQGQIKWYSDPGDQLWGGSSHTIGKPDDTTATIYVNTGQPAWQDSLSAVLIHEAAHIHYGTAGGDNTSAGEKQANGEEDRCFA